MPYKRHHSSNGHSHHHHHHHNNHNLNNTTTTNNNNNSNNGGSTTRMASTSSISSILPSKPTPVINFFNSSQINGYGYDHDELLDSLSPDISDFDIDSADEYPSPTSSVSTISCSSSPYSRKEYNSPPLQPPLPTVPLSSNSLSINHKQPNELLPLPLLGQHKQNQQQKLEELLNNTTTTSTTSTTTDQLKIQDSINNNNNNILKPIKDLLSCSFNFVSKIFKPEKVYFDTDNLYLYRNDSSMLNTIIPTSSLTTKQQTTTTQTLLTTTTTTTSTFVTPTIISSPRSSNSSNNDKNSSPTAVRLHNTDINNNNSPPIITNSIKKNEEMIDDPLLASYDIAQDNSGNSPSFFKNGAVNFPSPCFKTDAEMSPSLPLIPPDENIFRQTPPVLTHGSVDGQGSRVYTLFNHFCTLVLRNSNIAPQDKYRAKLCIGFCFTVFSFIPSWIIFFWLSGLKEPAFMAVFAIPMSGSSLWVLKRTGSTHYPGHILCFTLCFALTMNSYYTGGHQSTLRLLMSTVPIISALVCGRRASVQWSMVVLAILLLFFIANILGWEYVDGIPTITIRSHMNFIIDVTLVLITMAFTLCYQYFIDEAHRETKLKNEQLTIAKDAAIEAYQARQEFLATMSHEIRTPLNGLIGMATLLRDSMALPPEEKQMAKSVKSCGDILLRLVNDILDLSKLEANQMVVENISFNVRELVSEICHVLAGQAKEKGLTLDFEVHPKVPTYLCGDTGRILQVLMNLTGNALKFTSGGFVKIIIDVIEDDTEKISFRPGEFNICFRVQDSGIGVRPEAHQKIFEAFVQADPSDSRKYGGSGLGLYLCAKLVKLMQGEIGVYNNPHEVGATFWFILPMAMSDEPKAEVPSALKYAPVTIPASELLISNGANSANDSNESTEKIRVLVAEDNIINQRVAVKFLEKIGIKADVANDGNQVLSMLSHTAYQLIFMDFQMPVLDGLRCSMEIRDLESRGHWPDRLPIFICGLTANTMSTDKKRSQNCGMNHFVSKPFQVEQLRVAIQMSCEFNRLNSTINKLTLEKTQ